MNVAHLTNTTTIRNTEVSGNRAKTGLPSSEKRKISTPDVDREKLRSALDKLIRNTRFQYVLKGELSHLAVRIIDRDTDKIIREIPSRELQKIHENIERALGILFDELA